MKTSLSHLPESKQQDLQRVTQLIVETVSPEKVILFGSYATGTWVEDRYTEGHITYEYISDYDILVITKTGEKRKDYEITSQIENRLRFRTPVNVITHDIDYINQQLIVGRYFFTDIIKEGIILFESNNFPLSTPKKLTAKERSDIAEKDFENWFTSAKGFLESSIFNLEKGQYKIAVFLLHQAAERTYDAVMLVFTGYKPKTHNLDKLRTSAKRFSKVLYGVFPRNDNTEEHFFSLLQKGYIDARYNDDYKITKEELIILINRVTQLQAVTNEICRVEIDSFK